MNKQFYTDWAEINKNLIASGRKEAMYDIDSQTFYEPIEFSKKLAHVRTISDLSSSDNMLSVDRKNLFYMNEFLLRDNQTESSVNPEKSKDLSRVQPEVIQQNSGNFSDEILPISDLKLKLYGKQKMTSQLKFNNLINSIQIKARLMRAGTKKQETLDNLDNMLKQVEKAYYNKDYKSLKKLYKTLCNNLKAQRTIKRTKENIERKARRMRRFKIATVSIFFLAALSFFGYKFIPKHLNKDVIPVQTKFADASPTIDVDKLIFDYQKQHNQEWTEWRKNEIKKRLKNPKSQQEAYYQINNILTQIDKKGKK